MNILLEFFHWKSLFGVHSVHGVYLFDCGRHATCIASDYHTRHIYLIHLDAGTLLLVFITVVDGTLLIWIIKVTLFGNNMIVSSYLIALIISLQHLA